MDDLLSVFQDFDVANFLPAPEKFVNALEGWTRFFVLVAPVLVLCLGLWYFFKPPAEANHKLGFRTLHSMGSVDAWKFSQKLAGIFYMIVGGVLSVIMLIISLFFNSENAMAMLNTAVICVSIEAVVIIALHVLLMVLVGRAYDKDGNRRT